MASSIHTIARDGLVAAWSDPSVATAAGIAVGTWPTRVLKGSRDGFLGELHRGRLPAVEVFQVDDKWTALGDVDLGVVTSRWGIRVHAAAANQVQAEELVRAICYAGLIIARGNLYFKVGEETISGFGESPLGFSIEIQFQVQNAMDRATYETNVGAGGGTPSDGGVVGGIRRQFNYNDASPQSLLALPAGQALDNVEVIVVTPFNDAAATVQVGVDANHDAYMASSDADLTAAGTDWERAASDAGPITVKVWINPGTSTQGVFIVQIVTTSAS